VAKPSARWWPRALWLGCGSVMLGLAWWLPRDMPWLVNMLIPAGAWTILRGLA
jgi:hypothetical protein